MKTRTVLGWMAILVISFMPAVLWLYLGPGTEELVDYESITHSLGELFGLVGMTMFALTFILSTRISWIEDVFGGLDKVYITHAILGGLALIFILAHPIFLVLKFVPSEIDLAASYLLPSSYWSVNFGIFALIGMIALIFITLFTKMKYHRWKFTHEFMGLMFALAVAHIFLVRNSIAQDNIFEGYFVYATVVSLIGLFGFSYSLFIKNRIFKNAVYSVRSIQKDKDLFEITVVPEHKSISYKAGQFIFVRFYNNKISREAHPFSIASKSNADEIVLVVKKLGDYTSQLTHLKEGDRVSIEGPYGRFSYKEYSKRDQVWIAGGIGITPFLGMAQDIAQDSKLEGKVTLIYSVKNEDEIIGNSLFSEVSKKNPKFSFVPWVSSNNGRLTAKTIHDLGGRFKDKEFFFCGPSGFKDSLIASLVQQGISKSHIHEEVFDFR